MAICYAWQGRISQKCFSLLLCSWLHWLLLIGCTDTANYVHQKLRERNFRAPGAFSSGLLAKLCCHSCNTVVSFRGEEGWKVFSCLYVWLHWHSILCVLTLLDPGFLRYCPTRGGVRANPPLVSQLLDPKNSKTQFFQTDMVLSFHLSSWSASWVA